MSDAGSGNRLTSRSAVLALCFALVGSASMLYYHQGVFIPRAREMRAANGLGGGYSFGNDFYQVWLAARECVRGRSDPYSAEMTRDIQTGLFGRPLNPQIASDPVDRRVFPYPAFTLLLFWPAMELPFTVARVLFVVLLGAATFASVLLWLRALAWSPGRVWLVVIFLLTFCSYPVLEGIYAGQLGLLVAFLLAASILALQRGRLLPGGILLALTTIKPQVSALVIFYVIVWSTYDWRRRGRFCIGLFSAGLVLLGASLAVWPGWIESWVRTVLAYRDYTTPVLLNTAIASHLGPAAAGPATTVMTAGLLIVAVVIVWRNRAASAVSVEFWLTMGLLLSITAVALLPGQAVYDDVILLPGIFLIASRWRTLSSTWVLRSLLVMGAATLLWPWFTSFVLILLRPFLTNQQFYSNPTLSLPLRTAAVFPFIVLALLALAGRQPGKKSRAAHLSYGSKGL